MQDERNGMSIGVRQPSPGGTPGRFRGRLLPLLGAICLLAGACSPRGPEGASISGAELLSRMDSAGAPLVLDVRSVREYAAGHVPGAINIPYRNLSKRLAEVRPHAKDGVVVYCERGPRARVAEATLRQAGFDEILHLKGDMAGWRRAGFPIDRPAVAR